ncbi:hypothetical protein [Azoarcus sp. KH32C]|uniref:hypothetical protein n=1 Tax=Azoarcus sp. KH32C TaxID=748247 RepID=UPI0002387004|nr:hypothetical protein [Azoarcus sp. KH32C]BAL24479.1 hypothetical protein AZKH_2168 [Azoarcus sp. KH32C]
MKYRMKRHLLCAALIAALGGSATVAMSQTASTDVDQAVTTFDRTASASPTRAATDMSKTFSTLTGSEASAQILIDGLRSGTIVTLDPGSATTIPVTVTPSGPMGYGNVFITLALAQATLTQAGLTAPTAAELAVALNGGTLQINGQPTTFRGVLAMRASGMGWGQIAKESGFNLGKVVSELKSGNDHLAKSIKEGNAGSEKSAGKSTDKGNNRQAVDTSDRGGRVERSERPDKPERADKAERPERPDRPEKPDHPGKG